MFNQDLEKAEELEIKLPTFHQITGKAKKSQKTIGFTEYTKAFDFVDHNKLQKILQEVGIPDYVICLPRNLYAGQEALKASAQQRKL